MLTLEEHNELERKLQSAFLTAGVLCSKCGTEMVKVYGLRGWFGYVRCGKAPQCNHTGRML